MKNKFYLIFTALLVLLTSTLVAQERVVKVDFESNSFKNQPKIPFNEPFAIQGEMGRDIEYVEVLIRNHGAKWNLGSFSWNRISENKTETFNIVIPPILTSGSKYDFEIITYTRLSYAQKQKLVEDLRDRVAFYINNSFQFDGKNISIKNPKKVYKGLMDLIDEALRYQVSKNGITYVAPTKLILEELKKQNNFKFKKVLKGTKTIERNDLGNALILEKVNLITDMVISELMPFLNSELVQHYRVANIYSVSTDKERFTLPVNVGMYAWSKSANISETAKVENINFTPGAGITIPLKNKTRFRSKMKFMDSFALSAGVLFQPIRDANGVEYVTPGINLPVYTTVGLRFLKVIRLNAGVVIVGEKGVKDFKKLSVAPTVGLALELNLWLGIKK